MTMQFAERCLRYQFTVALKAVRGQDSSESTWYTLSLAAQSICSVLLSRWDLHFCYGWWDV